MPFDATFNISGNDLQQRRRNLKKELKGRYDKYANSTLAKSRRQGWSLNIERGISADGGQPVVGYIVPDRTGEADGFTFIDG